MTNAESDYKRITQPKGDYGNDYRSRSDETGADYNKDYLASDYDYKLSGNSATR